MDAFLNTNKLRASLPSSVPSSTSTGIQSILTTQSTSIIKPFYNSTNLLTNNTNTTDITNLKHVSSHKDTATNNNSDILTTNTLSKNTGIYKGPVKLP